MYVRVYVCAHACICVYVLYLKLINSVRVLEDVRYEKCELVYLVLVFASSATCPSRWCATFVRSRAAWYRVFAGLI